MQLLTESLTDLPSKISAAKELDFSEHSSPQASSSIQLDSLLQKKSVQHFSSSGSDSPPVFRPPLDTAELIQLPQEMQIYLIGALSNRYSKEVAV